MTDATELDEATVRARHRAMPARGGSEDIAFLLAALDEARAEVDRERARASEALGEAETATDDFLAMERGHNAQVQHARKHYLRAEAAESALAAVRALADDMDERGKPGANDSPMDAQSRRQIREDVGRLRAALATPTTTNPDVTEAPASADTH